VTNLFFRCKYDGFRGEENFAKQLGMKRMFLFQFLLANSNKVGMCDLSQRQLASLMGMAVGTVNTLVSDLETFRWEEKPIIKIVKVPYKNGERNIYYILQNPFLYNSIHLGVDNEPQEVSDPSSQVEQKKSSYQELERCETSSYQNEEHLIEYKPERIKEKDIPTVSSNKKEEELDMFKTNDVVKYFKDCMKEKKNQDYKVVYGRDQKIVKDKFLKYVDGLTFDERKMVIDTIVVQYERWTTNDNKYPLTILTLGYEWVVKKAIDEMKKEKEILSQAKVDAVVSEERTAKAKSRILGMFGGDE
jgi:hypothetical protein